jgi:serine/threonine protein kinase, bacterial
MKAGLLNNRYRIIQTLGRGGFGETYLTEDTHMPSGRKCVLKQLKPIVKQPKTPLWMKERFQREAAILEELGEGHEQIPRLYAYFSEDDKFYLIQEWIEGLTLDQYWEKEGNLHRDEVRQILVQLLPVLDYVHARRIIHRDIKPENIILRQGDHLPFLIDFGAVKEAMATEINQGSSSTYSASIGTPGYMSSEQAAGRPIYSSDLYSLGLTAIFLLTGKSPNELETDPRNGEIIWQEHAFNLDPELAAVLDKSIRFHPRDRFSTAQEMLAALNHGVSTSQTNPTGVTLNIAPRNTNLTEHPFPVNKRNTVALKSPERNKPKKRGFLASVGLFLLIAVGVGAGTFAAGFAVISNLLRSPEAETQQAEVEPPTRQPDLFSDIKIDDTNQANEEEKIAQEDQKEEQAQDAARKAQDEKTAKDNQTTEQNPDSEVAEEQPETTEDKPQKTLAKIDLESASEINIPILTTGTSESQLVSTLGQPTSERRGWQPNSRVLVYYDVVPDQVNLTYQSDDTGKIRQTDIDLNQSVSLGTMQQTMAKMLGGNAPADVKEKLRSVYNRQTNFSFFKVDNLEGKVQRDTKDRINISVWETGYQ